MWSGRQAHSQTEAVSVCWPAIIVLLAFHNSPSTAAFQAPSLPLINGLLVPRSVWKSAFASLLVREPR